MGAVKETLLITAGLIVAAVGIVTYSNHTMNTDKDQAAAEIARYGVVQLHDKALDPITAREITAVRTDLTTGKAPSLQPGERYGQIIRTIVTTKNVVYNCGGRMGTCWAAVLVLDGDDQAPGYRVVHVIGDSIEPFKNCFQPGNRIVIQWRAMQNHHPDTTRIAKSSWLRLASGALCPG